MITVIVIKSKVKSVVIFYAIEKGKKKKTVSYVTQEKEISIEHVHVMSHRYFTT